MGVNNESYDIGFIVAIQIIPKATAALGLATLTFRWNDGVARSKVILCALTSLASLGEEVFPVVQASGTNMTMEAVLVGSGAQFNIGLGFA